MSGVPISTNPTLQSNQQYGNFGQSFSPTHIADLFMSNMIMSKLGNIMNSDCKLTPTNMFKFILLLSSNEIKTMIGSIMSYLLEIAKKSPMTIYLLVSKFMKKPEQIIHHEQEISIPTYDFTINIDDVFINSLYTYLIKSKKCHYNKNIIKYDTKNVKETIVHNKISNIVIDINDHIIKIDNSIVVGCNNCTDELVSYTINDSTKNVSNDITRFTDLLTPEQGKIVQAIRSELNWGTTYEDVKTYLMKIYGIKNVNLSFTEFTITDILTAKHKKLDKRDTLIDVIIMGNILSVYFGICHTTASKTLLTKNCLLYDINNYYECDPEILKRASAYYYEVPTNSRALVCSKLGCTTESMKETFKNFVNSQSLHNTTNIKKILSMNLSIQTKDESKINQSDMEPLINKFFAKIYKSTKQKDGSNIKINFLNFEIETNVSESENPEYTEYIEKRELVSKLDKDKSSNELLLFLNTPVPTKTIIKETINKKVIPKQINEIYKSFDTLYLKEKDKKKLSTSLDQFKNKKDILKDMGIQNKLNILLYGDPGTGKTTTIQAIASYLQRDIYYVDLQKAILNEDLQMIFEYVNKNVSGGGIIVIEDIDAMTDVVLKRKETTNESTVNDIMRSSEQKLTLEYFLNILQGTLTMDDSIFIVTTNHLQKLDPAFYRDGRFDVKLELEKCDHHQIQSIFTKMMSRKLQTEILELIPENTFTPATIIYHIKNYIFDSEITDEEIFKDFIKL